MVLVHTDRHPIDEQIIKEYWLLVETAHIVAQVTSEFSGFFSGRGCYHI